MTSQQEGTRRGRARTVGVLLLLGLGAIACLLGTPWGLLILLGLTALALSKGGRQQ